MFYLATYWTHKQATAWAITQKDMTAIDTKYSDEALCKRAIVAMRMSEDEPDHRGFLDLLFGHESTLSKEEFDKGCIGE